MVPGFPRVNSSQIITWGGRILNLHHNYVAGYTSPLLFPFERTHNYYIEEKKKKKKENPRQRHLHCSYLRAT